MQRTCLGPCYSHHPHLIHPFCLVNWKSGQWNNLFNLHLLHNLQPMHRPRTQVIAHYTRLRRTLWVVRTMKTTMTHGRKIQVCTMIIIILILITIIIIITILPMLLVMVEIITTTIMQIARRTRFHQRSRPRHQLMLHHEKRPIVHSHLR